MGICLYRTEWLLDNPFPFFYTAGNIHWGMTFLRISLRSCTYAFGFLLIAFLIAKSKKLKAVFLIFLILGGINFACSSLMERKEFGALYELDDYTVLYEAYLYDPNSDDYPPMFCIVSIDHSRGWDIIREKPCLYFYDIYSIKDIYLPYKRSYENEYADFYPGESNSLVLGTNGAICDVELGNIVNDQSYTRLANEVLSTNGEVVASINGKVYHNKNWCSHVAQIKNNNLIRFNTTWEAEALGFDVCQDCNYW